ncbi:MAG: outer membrane beta-barrel protein [Thiohalomonadales bacterium]
MIIRYLSALVIGGILLVINPVSADVSSDITVTRASDTKKGSIGKYVGGSFAYVYYNEASDSDVGFSVYGGVTPWESSGFELAYVNLGESKDSSGNTFKVSLFRVGVIGRTQRSVTLSLFAQAGVAFWNADASENGGTISDSGGDLYLGAGVENLLNGNTSIRYALDYYSVSDFNDAGFDENLFYLSIGFQTKF